jgi:hypothetical protein
MAERARTVDAQCRGALARQFESEREVPRSLGSEGRE